MTALEIIKVVSEFGAVAVLVYVVYLFVGGKIISQDSVERLMKAQAEHIGDLQKTMDNKLHEILEVLKDIREDGRTS